MNNKGIVSSVFGVALLLAGCTTMAETSSIVPFLKDIPLLGQLFLNKNSGNNEGSGKGFFVGTAVPPKVESVPSKQPIRVDAPAWQPGAEWHYSDGYSLRVKSTNGGVTVFQRLDAPDRWLSRRGFLREASKSKVALKQVIYRTISPDAGKYLTPGRPLAFRREYLSNGTLIEHNTSWSIEGREKIAVPAGQFDAWVVVMRSRSLKSNWVGFERWWYSPEVQHFVRMEYKYGSSPDGSRVLMSYKLGAQAVSGKAKAN